MNFYYLVGLIGLAYAVSLDRVLFVPTSYEAVATFHIPYIPFSEPLKVHYDGKYNGGSQKVDFWNGATVFINSAAGSSFTFQPNDSQLTCANTTTCTNQAGTQYVDCSSAGAVPKGSLQHIFPNDMSLFVSTGKKVLITRCERYINQYQTGRPRGNGGEYSDYTKRGGDPVCAKPFDHVPVLADEWAFDTKEGGKLDHNDNTTVGDVLYLGRYRFYTGPDGLPVQLRFVGHNIVLGGSHFDEYIMDYLSIVSTKVHPSVFNPPTGMDCPPAPSSTSGPTVKAMSSHQEDIHMLMPEGQETRDRKFNEYNEKFGKTHADEPTRLLKRSHFHRSLRYVNSFNRQNKKYHLRVNHMSDQEQIRGRPGVKWTPAIAKRFFSETDKKPLHVLSQEYVSAKAANTLPYEVDWRQRYSLLPARGGQRDNTSRGYFTNPAKDQGTCGSCWAFGAAGNLEGQLANLTMNDARGIQWPQELSEQNIMDCAWTDPMDTNVDSTACGGGQDWIGFDWMIGNNKGQIASSSSYGPYMNQNGFCHFDQARGMTNSVVINGQTYTAQAQPGFAIRGWGSTAVYACSPNCTEYIINNLDYTQYIEVLKSLKPQSMDNLFDKVWHHGPISVAIDASPPDFYYYGGGIYDNYQDCTTYSLDHSVLVVGFGTADDGSKYWIVKNSWSSSWGEDGYFRIAAEHNPCGILTTPMYVQLA